MTDRNIDENTTVLETGRVFDISIILVFEAFRITLLTERYDIQKDYGKIKKHHACCATGLIVV